MIASFDAALVALSVAVAMFASYVTLDLAGRVCAADGTAAGRWWLAGGAFSMGTGIWSMHFIGMLAHELPIAVSYHVPTTFASLLVAVVVSGFALQVVSAGHLTRWRLLGSGTLMGAGIALMHYSGMEAMEVEPAVRYDAGVVAVSVAIAIAASIAALWIALRLRTRTGARARWKKAGSALVMGLAISGMHYTGMAAASFAADTICTVAPHNVSNEWLAGAIGGFTFLFLLATLLLSVVDARLEDHTARLADSLRKINMQLVVRSEELAGNNRRLEHEMRERGQAERALRESEERYRVLVELSSDWTWEQDASLRFVALPEDGGPTAAAKVGKARWELPGTEPVSCTWEEHRALLQAREPFHDLLLRRVCAPGTVQYVSVSGKPIFDSRGAFTGYRGVATDVTKKKEAEERLAYLAQYDSLTGLPNRSLLRDRLGQALARADRDGRMVAVMFVDLDHFKQVNDTLGHGTGDKVLQAAAALLKQTLREVDTVARLGGDEFTIVLEGITEVEQVEAVADKIRRAFAAPLLAQGGRDIFASASIGVTLYPGDVDNADGLLQAADIAMYHAKQEGRDRCEFYAAELNAQAAGQMRMEGLLRRALERGELSLHYQPKVQVSGGRITGMEALLRWNSAELGAVSPAKFIPLAERSGLIVPIGEWVLQTACAQARAWREQGFELPISVNLSPRQFRDKGLLEAVAGTLAQAGLPARLLELEITEGMIMEHPDKAIALLEQIHALGVQLSVDDFGTGYSSLAYLKRFPVQKLKIDRSFICDLGRDGDASIVTAIIAMAASLRLGVVAEGVETREQLEVLAQRGCHEYQGYYFSKPLPAAELVAILRQSVPARGGILAAA